PLGGSFFGFRSPREAVRVSVSYGKWYLDRLLPLPRAERPVGGGSSRTEKRRDYVARRSRRLARASLRAMAIHRTDLERRQITVDRLAGEGMDLFLICATAAYAEFLAEQRGIPSAWKLADHFFSDAQRWI